MRNLYFMKNHEYIIGLGDGGQRSLNKTRLQSININIDNVTSIKRFLDLSL